MKKIVIIENDEDILNMVGLVLTIKGFDVLPSQTRIPIEKVIADKPNLILLDYYLDDGYGKEICLEVKSNPLTRHIPVVIFSAMFGLEQAAKDSCADAYIAKPFNIEDLEKLVTDLTI